MNKHNWKKKIPENRRGQKLYTHGKSSNHFKIKYGKFKTSNKCVNLESHKVEGLSIFLNKQKEMKKQTSSGSLKDLP